MRAPACGAVLRTAALLLGLVANPNQSTRPRLRRSAPRSDLRLILARARMPSLPPSGRSPCSLPTFVYEVRGQCHQNARFVPSLPLGFAPVASRALATFSYCNRFARLPHFLRTASPFCALNKTGVLKHCRDNKVPPCPPEGGEAATALAGLLVPSFFRSRERKKEAKKESGRE